jgi:hypothetical protein
MDANYIEKLKLIGILVSEPHKSSNLHQPLVCAICNHEWIATPKSKMQHFKKSGFKGCPLCTDKEKYKEERINYITKLNEKFEIITDLSVIKLNNQCKIQVKNKNCGHIFVSKIHNLLHRDVNCRVCNDEIKRTRCKDQNELKYLEGLIIRTGFRRYKYKVYRRTKETYEKYKSEINPNNFPRVLAGRGEGYHLDHIASIYQCYKHNVPAELCAHKDNLRLIPWYDNVTKHTKINAIPEILKEYFLPASKPSAQCSTESVTNTASSQH